jgi:hypothetical protein
MCFSLHFLIILENPTIVVITNLFFSIFVLAYNGTCDKHAWIKIKSKRANVFLVVFFFVIQSK